MLRINCEVRESTIKGAGKGLFSCEKIISKGQIVWAKSINDIAVLKSEYEQLKELGLHEYIRRYSSIEKDGNFFIDGDNCIFMNHSLTPNVLFLDFIGVSTKNVEMGEELTCNYYTITEKSHADFLLSK